MLPPDSPLVLVGGPKIRTKVTKAGKQSIRENKNNAQEQSS